MAYRSSQPDLAYGSRPVPTQRWDAERFANEGQSREISRYEERDRVEYRDELPMRSRRQSVAMERETEREREREYYRSPSPPPMRRPMRPGMGLRRQSSLDTFDRKPTYPRYMEREEYGPPALRGSGRGYMQKEYERVEIDGPPRYYQDPMPERIREREIVRRRRRSRSSSSSSSDDSVSTRTTARKEFPKRGRTRMPAKLVSERAIIELGYPFEKEGSIIIIHKALGREHIDEVIQLSEKYKTSEKSSSSDRVVEEKRTETFYESNTTAAPQVVAAPVVPAQPVMAPLPPPPAPIYAAAPQPQVVTVAPPQQSVGTELVERKHTIIDHHGDHDHVSSYRRARSMGPTPRHQEYYTTTGAVAPYGQHPYGNEVMVIGAGPHINHQHQAFTSGPGMIRQDIRSMAAEAEALRAEKRAARELRRADRIRYHGDARASDGQLSLYDGGGRGSEPVVEVRRSRKGKMSLVVPSRYR